MSNIQVKLRRGTEAEHDTTSGGFTGAEGEVTVDTTNDTLRVHDGSTVGGVRLAKHSELSTGGGGTVTSVGTGAGLSGGPITTSGTLSLSTINDMTVLGNTSGFTNVPVPTFIKDEDDMASDSATALATQQSIKAYVDAQVAASTVSKYTTGWFNNTTGLANGGTYTFTHNLGTKDINVTLWMATNASGANQKEVNLTLRWTGSVNSEGGAQILDVSTTQLVVQLAEQGWLYLDSSGNWQNGNWGTTHTHIKVVVIG
jgi:hypothetical protein